MVKKLQGFQGPKDAKLVKLDPFDPPSRGDPVDDGHQQIGWFQDIPNTKLGRLLGTFLGSEKKNSVLCG